LFPSFSLLLSSTNSLAPSLSACRTPCICRHIFALHASQEVHTAGVTHSALRFVSVLSAFVLPETQIFNPGSITVVCGFV
jgi:hypothetical protein